MEWLETLAKSLITEEQDTEVLSEVTDYASYGAAENEDPNQTTVVPYRSTPSHLNLPLADNQITTPSNPRLSTNAPGAFLLDKSQ